MAEKEAWVPVYITLISSTRLKIVYPIYGVLVVFYIFMILVLSYFTPELGLVMSGVGLVSFIVAIIRFWRRRHKRLGAEMKVENRRMLVQRPGRELRIFKVTEAHATRGGSIFVKAKEGISNYNVKIDCVFDTDVKNLLEDLKNIVSEG